MKEKNVCRFKKLLEYFIAHLEFIQNENTDGKGYTTYIEPLISKNTFQISGQGYKGATIQNQILEWQDYGISTICINIQPHFGKRYFTKKCYLNWKNTGINIFAKWDTDRTKVTHLVFTDYLYWLDPPTYKDSDPFSIIELGLFDEREPNEEVKKMFDEFYIKIYNLEMNNMTK